MVLWKDFDQICMYVQVDLSLPLVELHIYGTHHLSLRVTKPTTWPVCPAKTLISLGIRPLWSESSLSTSRSFGSLATHWAHSKDSDWMPRLIWVFAGRTGHFVLMNQNSTMWAATGQNQQNGYAPSEDSDQPGHPPNLTWLIRVFTVHMKKDWVFSYTLSAQWRLWSDWADVQADLSLCLAHTHFIGFVISWLMYLFKDMYWYFIAFTGFKL